MPTPTNLIAAQDHRVRQFAIAAIKRARSHFYESDIRTAARLADRMWHLGWACVWCGGPFQCIDHVMPLALGGRDFLDNLVPCCISCNNHKNDLSPERWVDGETKGSETKCGTAAGYRRHKDRGTNVCDECRAAYSDYSSKANAASTARREAKAAEARRIWQQQYPEASRSQAHLTQTIGESARESA